jgi:DnaJ-class molecular chaperone
MNQHPRFIPNFPESSCRNCAGTGFLIIHHTSPEGYIEPNEVQECVICNGTGKRNPNQTI